jgi:hypothetical protein
MLAPMRTICSTTGALSVNRDVDRENRPSTLSVNTGKFQTEF